jgi:hypothetical protein
MTTRNPLAQDDGYPLAQDDGSIYSAWMTALILVYPPWVGIAKFAPFNELRFQQAANSSF